MAECVVLHWPSIGPYHLARLRACQREAPAGTEVVGLAVAGEVEGRPWSAVEAASGIRVEVAFPAAQYHTLRAAESASAVEKHLEKLRPFAVGLSGYGMPESRRMLQWCRRNDAARILMSETKADDAPRHWLKEMVKRYLVSRFDSALCGGTPHRRYLEQLGMKPERIFEKYDVVDNETFATAAEQVRRQPEAFRQLPGLNDPRPFFLVSSRMIERKNLRNLLLAFDSYRRAQPQGWRLVILGTGPREAALRALVSERTIPDVVFAGFQQMEQLVAYYALAAVFIHPARQEQWGLVVNEAMACGLPVLVSKTVGAASDLVKEGSNGFTFDPSEAGQLDALLQKVSAPNFPLHDFGLASREIISHWTPEHFARGFWAAVGAAGKSNGRTSH